MSRSSIRHRALHHALRPALALALVAAMVIALPWMFGAPVALAGTGGLATCPDGSPQPLGQLCSNLGFALCPAGGASINGAACPFNANQPAASNSSSLPVTAQQTCPDGIVISVTQSCPASTGTTSSSGGVTCTASGGVIWNAATGPAPVSSC